VSNYTWRELVRRDFSADDRQMDRWAAELAESAVVEAGSLAYASAKRKRFDYICTAAAAAPPSIDSVPAQQVVPSSLALPSPRILPAAARAGRENEWKRFYASL
jgi:hypothetical protein